MNHAERLEHLFHALGGRALIVPDLPEPVSAINDAGDILQFLTAGLSPDKRADILLLAIVRHALPRIDPRELLALLNRALHPGDTPHTPCTFATVARWIPDMKEEGPWQGGM